jgi:Uma2 family endonuclease
MATARRLHHTYADYLAVEHTSPVKHEYLDGEIFAMAGGTPEHAALAAQMIALVQARLPAARFLRI